MRVAAAGSRTSLLLLGAVVLAVARGGPAQKGPQEGENSRDRKRKIKIEVPH